MVVAVALVTPASPAEPLAQQSSRQREPARTMSYRGAPWLERVERAGEERPDELVQDGGRKEVRGRIGAAPMERRLCSQSKQASWEVHGPAHEHAQDGEVGRRRLRKPGQLLELRIHGRRPAIYAVLYPRI